MATLAMTRPESHSYRPLQEYVNSRIAFLRDISDCRAKNRPLPTNGPSLPINDDPSSRYVVNNYVRTNGLELQILGYDTTAVYQSKQTVDPVMRIEKVLPGEAAILAAFGGTLPKVVGWDPGELITAASILSDDGGTVRTRSDEEQGSKHSSRRSDRRDIWSQNQGEHGAMVHLPSISDMETAMPTNKHDSIQSFEHELPTRLPLEPLLVDFNKSSLVAKNEWEETKSKRAELDMACDAILKLCGDEPSLIAVGNGTFRTGFNLASKHESFKVYFGKKA
ncbi:hypothetical protein BGX24_009060 [Mortierella sp. AD032]|nr:hypothetical protein BGX24_009060 [Mortierella sp. AD032]